MELTDGFVMSRNITEEIIQGVSKRLENDFSLKPESRILIGVSGGPDSIFLAYCLWQLEYQIGLVHVNYQMRGVDAEEDEKLVRNYAWIWDVPVFVKKVNGQELKVANGSFQQLARNIRYEFFEQILEEEQFDLCALAHQADDRVENLLLSLTKGNSLDLWHEIPSRREVYIRPLLDIRKSDIIKALEAEGLNYRIDTSNEENNYLRNQFRNIIIPELEKVNPSFSSQVIEKNTWYQRQQRFIKSHIATWLDHQGSNQLSQHELRFDKLPQVANSWLDMICLYWLEEKGVHGHALWQAGRLWETQSGKWVETSIGRVYRTQYGLAIQQKLSNPKRDHRVLEGVDKNVQFPFKGNLIYVIKYNSVIIPKSSTTSLYLDIDKLSFPLVFRSWEKGDKMQPLGMKGNKKLSDIFSDLKVSPLKKDQMVIIESGKKIAGLLGFRIAEWAKVDEKTQEVLKISFKKA